MPFWISSASRVCMWTSWQVMYWRAISAALTFSLYHVPVNGMIYSASKVPCISKMKGEKSFIRHYTIQRYCYASQLKSSRAYWVWISVRPTTGVTYHILHLYLHGTQISWGQPAPMDASVHRWWPWHIFQSDAFIMCIYSYSSIWC